MNSPFTTRLRLNTHYSRLENHISKISMCVLSMVVGNTVVYVPILASHAGNTSYGETTYNDSVVNQSVYIEYSLYGFTNSLIHWYTINMRAGITTSSPAETCRQQARNLLGGDNVTTEGALIKLADAFLDAKEWRLEEVRILRQQQEELRETREYLFRLARALGEDVPTRVTRATGGYPGGGSRKNRTKHTGKVAVYG